MTAFQGRSQILKSQSILGEFSMARKGCQRPDFEGRGIYIGAFWWNLHSEIPGHK
jgi:hypothetical protein